VRGTSGALEDDCFMIKECCTSFRIS